MPRSPRASARGATGMLFSAALVASSGPPSAFADGPPFADTLREGFRERLETHDVAYIDLAEPRLRVAVAPRFVWVRDLSLSLPGPPWMDSGPFLEAFDLARIAWEATGQPDDVKALAVFVSFDVGATAPFYVGLANDIEGIGLPLFDDSPGSALDGLIWMGSLDALTEAGPEYRSEAFVHEVAHRWGVYVDVRHPTLGPGVLRGRQDRHWSFFADTDASPMDGNDWVNEGKDAFTRFARPHIPRFHPLDLYLMGHRAPDAVPPITLIRAFESATPSWVNVNATTLPGHRLDVVVRLSYVETETVTIEHVLAAEGPRVPVEGPKQWPIGVVLLSSGFNGTASVEERSRFEDDLDAMLEAFSHATAGAMTLRAETIDPGLATEGEPCRDDSDCHPARSDGCHPDLRVCARSCRADDACRAGQACCDDWCGTGCPVASRDAGAQDVATDSGSEGGDAGPSDGPESAPYDAASPSGAPTSCATTPGPVLVALFAWSVFRRRVRSRSTET